MQVLLALIVVISTASSVWAIGNEPFTPVAPVPWTSSAPSLTRAWQLGEIPQVFGRYFPTGFVYSGGLHGTSGTCVSSVFATNAFTVGPPSDHTTANAAIDYSAMGVNCSSGTHVAFTAICSLASDSSGNWHRVVGTNYFVNAIDATPTTPLQCHQLMKVTIASGAITAVTDVSTRTPQLAPALQVIDPTQSGAVCGTGVSGAQAIANLNALQTAITTAQQGEIKIIELPCLITIPSTLVFQGVQSITLFAPSSPVFGGVRAGLRSLDINNPVVSVKNNGGTQSLNIVLDGIQISYASLAASGVCAVSYLNSGGAVRRVDMTGSNGSFAGSTIRNGVCHNVDINGPTGELYFLFIDHNTQIVSNAIALQATSDGATHVLDFYISDVQLYCNTICLDIGQNVVTLVEGGSLFVNGSPTINIHGTGPTPVFWVTLTGIKLETAQCSAIIATNVGTISIDGGQIYRGSGVGCPAIVLGNGVDNTIISGVNFWENVGGGVQLGGTSRNISVLANHFKSNGPFAIKNDALSDNNMISSNFIYDSGTPAIIDSNPVHTTVGPNSLSDNTGMSVFKHGIRIDDLTGGGDAPACFHADGTLYRGTAGCP